MGLDMDESAAIDDTWSACPGCGVSLPGRLVVHQRSNASEACWQVRGLVTGHEFDNLVALGQFHQLTVDAYGAQHAGGSAPPLGVAFALIGLRLSLDEGWEGAAVREAHRYLATTSKDWPVFVPPPRRAFLTVVDVAQADSPDAHAKTVRRWADEVWAGWEASHGEVVALIGARLPLDVRKRLQGR
jgi:hypothetical protein